MELKGAAVASFLKRPDPAVRAVLVYGADVGLVRERIEALAHTVVDDLSDPFRVTTLTGPDLVKEPSLLPDEASALSMMGGRRLVLVRDLSDQHTRLLKDFIENPVGDALVLFQAGSLLKASSLRKLFEGSKTAAALACYADEGRALEAVIQEMFRDQGVSTEAEVLAFLCDHLGSDRALTRSEIGKLLTYIGSARTVTLEDARACVGDTARLGLDDLCSATAGGNPSLAIRTLLRLLGEGTAGVAVARSLLRHFSRLQLVAGQVAEGRSPEQAMGLLRPPVFPSQGAAFRAQVKSWSAVRLMQALDLIQEAECELKTTGVREAPVLERLVLRLAGSASSRGRAG
ncbi:DNA polymerase III subunit delta [Phaeovibrio sulfidiphilus]|uniref:DNA-directed DNA polymerase n=1 Tax=Phaeovibrio sulfidiphilus TaxID=1220600 RepID=A0A8J6YMW9_9PROT|nr:DNA polymerase III subunit delta [Phaeovibrio sulfidiphilus]MBE1237570.1 DNA polymerase III subunit delta [Phaeovibrio sulfidiphilus]